MQTAFIFSTVLLWVVVLFNLLITFRLIRIVAPEVWEGHLPKLRVGQLAPAFECETFDGQKYSLFTFRSTSFLLIFISFECTHCRVKIPDFMALENLAKKVGVRLYLVCDSDRAKIQAIQGEFGITTPILIANRENSIWKDYKVGAVPFYCLLDEYSRVQATGLLDANLETLVKVWKINSSSAGENRPETVEP
jgi:peroxiredoxin